MTQLSAIGRLWGARVDWNSPATDDAAGHYIVKRRVGIRALDELSGPGSTSGSVAVTLFKDTDLEAGAPTTPSPSSQSMLRASLQRAKLPTSSVLKPKCATQTSGKVRRSNFVAELLTPMEMASRRDRADSESGQVRPRKLQGFVGYHKVGCRRKLSNCSHAAQRIYLSPRNGGVMGIWPLLDCTTDLNQSGLGPLTRHSRDNCP